MWINTICECAAASGCVYKVSMCDGQHFALFTTTGEKKVSLDHLVACQNRNGSLFFEEDGRLTCEQPPQVNHFRDDTKMVHDNVESDITEQRKRADVFLHKCFDMPVCYAPDGSELSYGVMYAEGGKIEITYLN